ncbi:MAG TPA: hypothetical protein PKV67_01165 [Hyphomonas sp.]|nr:hypothetical protein [Hyphomonas sp.]
MTSERLRKRIPEFGPLSDFHHEVLEAADVIAALVAALEEMRQHNLDSAYLTSMADAALAMARKP